MAKEEKSRLDDPGFLNSLPSGGSREFFTAAKAYLKERGIDWFVLDYREHPKQREAWSRYFRYKGWRVWFMKKFENREIERALFPAEWPELFDENYVAPLEVAETIPVFHPRPHIQGRRANLHVLKEAPQYESVAAMTKELDIEDWRFDDRGIWVNLFHFQNSMGHRDRATPEQQSRDRLTKAFPTPEARESDKTLAASPALVKTLTDQRRVRADIPTAPHWSDLGS